MEKSNSLVLLVAIIVLQLLIAWGHVYIWGHWSWLYFIDGSLWIGTFIMAILIGAVSSLISGANPGLRLLGAVSAAIISGVAACLAELKTFEGGFEWLLLILLIAFAAFFGFMTAFIGIKKVIEAFGS